MICAVLFWLPIKVARHFLSPVTDMFESLGQLSNQELDDLFKES